MAKRDPVTDRISISALSVVSTTVHSFSNSNVADAIKGIFSPYRSDNRRKSTEHAVHYNANIIQKSRSQLLIHQLLRPSIWRRWVQINHLHCQPTCPLLTLLLAQAMLYPQLYYLFSAVVLVCLCSFYIEA